MIEFIQWSAAIGAGVGLFIGLLILMNEVRHLAVELVDVVEIIEELTDGGAHISPDAAGFGYCEYCRSEQPYELEHHDKDCAYAKARALIAAVKGGE